MPGMLYIYLRSLSTPSWNCVPKDNSTLLIHIKEQDYKKPFFNF
jgi:hypothetical protein